MALSRRSVGLADLPYRAPYGAPHAAPEDAPASPPLATRKVDIAALRADGTPLRRQIRIPEHPVFTAAFAAFGRGTLIATPQGMVAIEDLQPGDTVRAEGGQDARVQWIGTSLFAAARAEDAAHFRVMAGSFGLARPEGCVTFGPAARLRHGPGGLLTPIAQLVDGEAVIRVRPQAPVELFHVMLERHGTLRASGLDCESYHPGQAALRGLPPSLRARFLEMFPGIAAESDFGPLTCARAPDIGVVDLEG